jgi:hypothetical protein
MHVDQMPVGQVYVGKVSFRKWSLTKMCGAKPKMDLQVQQEYSYSLEYLVKYGTKSFCQLAFLSKNKNPFFEGE